MPPVSDSCHVAVGAVSTGIDELAVHALAVSSESELEPSVTRSAPRRALLRILLYRYFYHT